MYAIIYVDEDVSYMGEISETLFTARPMIQINCPATSTQLARTLLVDAASVRLIRVLPSARLMQAFAEFYAPTHCGGDEADLYQIVNGYYPWEAIRESDGYDDEEDVAA